MYDLSDRIRAAREKAGLTHDYVAAHLEVSRVQAWRIENDTKSISAKRLFQLAGLFGVDARKMFEGDNSIGHDQALIRCVEQVVALVESCAHNAGANPSPAIVSKAVAAVLQQELGPSLEIDIKPLQTQKYADLVKLIFEAEQIK